MIVDDDDAYATLLPTPTNFCSTNVLQFFLSLSNLVLGKDTRMAEKELNTPQCVVFLTKPISQLFQKFVENKPVPKLVIVDKIREVLIYVGSDETHDIICTNLRVDAKSNIWN